MEIVEVECYSGARYAERPVAFTWRGKRLSINSVERAWQTPGGLAFVVYAADGRRFELNYAASTDQWTAHSSET